MQYNENIGEELENASPLPNEVDNLKIATTSESNNDVAILNNTNLQKNELISEISVQNYGVLLEECRQLSGNEIPEDNICNFALNFAKNCNYLGIPQNVSEGYALLKFNLLEEEINSCFEQAYIENVEEFARFTNIANLQEWKNRKEENNIEELSSYDKAPPIPDSIYKNLPELLKKSCDIFVDRREKDVFLIGALGVLSGCLPNTEGVYFGSKVYPNLFCFIIAPPASGKGVVKYAKAFAAKYHDNVIAESKKLQREYEDKLAVYNRFKRGFTPLVKPQQPDFKVVFIPANTSLSMIIKHLQNNDGNGIICESEADTMGNAKKQDWGDYSPLLRAGFHHESYALSRKTNQEYLEVLEPKISVVLTGTPSQLPNLIKSVEDGLFSRFIFYSYKSEPVWNDPFRKVPMSFNKYFEQAGEEVFNLIKYLRKSPTKIYLSNIQSEIFNFKFQNLLKEVNHSYGEDTASIVRRLGLVAYRICMVLTALNKVENGDLTEELECFDEDFDIAMTLCEVFLRHSIESLNNIPKKYINEDKRSKLWRDMLNKLPDEFERKDAVALTEKFPISARSIDTMLRQEEEKTIVKVGNGKFKKM